MMRARNITILQTSRERQRGLAAMEFAIALPLLILLALAVTELGRGLYQYNTLTKAVRQGVRHLSDVAIGTVGHIDISGHIADTQNLVVYGDVDGGTTPVLPGFSTANVTVGTVNVTLPGGGITPNHVQVSASYTFTPLFPALSNLGYAMVPTMTASVVERALTL
jgi:Flp pilus assembly protein TadG